MKPVAFKANAGKMGFRELFRVAGGGFMGILACTFKLFRLIGPDADGYGMRSFGDEIVRLEYDRLPGRVLKATEKYRAKLEKLGFIPGFAYSLECYGAQEAHGLVFRHPDGKSAVSIAFARCVRNEQETVTTVFSFCTLLTNDTYIMTSNNKPQMNKPESFQVEYLPGEQPKAVYERHLERIADADAKPRKIRHDDDLSNLVLNCENEETAFNMERGVYVKMSKSEIANGRRVKEEYDRSGGRGPRRQEADDDDE